MLIFSSFFGNNIYTNYSLCIIYYNICIYLYLFLFLFCLIFLFDTKYIKSITDLKFLSKLNFLTFILITILLSMSGIPPFFGFLGKFLIFIFFFSQQKFIFITIYSILSFFTTYYYIQNIRFLVNKKKIIFLPKKGFFNFLNLFLMNCIIFFNFFNLFGLFYSEDFLYFFLNIINHKNFF